MPKIRPNINISPLALLTLAACGGGATESGGGGGGSPPSFSQAAAGKVEDGPLLNALAFLDYNDNGILDAGEPSDRTDITGGYSLTSTQANYSIVAVTDGTTVDQISKSVVSGVTLKAPSGASMVTPTTTLMEDGNLTAAQVVAVLGLPEGMNPLTFSAHAVGVDLDDALAVEKANQQIMSVVNSFAAVAEGSGVSVANAFEAAIKSVAEEIKVQAIANTTLDLSDPTELTKIQTKIVSKVNVLAASDATIKNGEFAATMVEAVKAAGAVNAKIKAIIDTNLKSEATRDILSITQVLKNQVKEAAEATVTNNAGNAAGAAITTAPVAFAAADGTALNTAISNKAPTDMTLSSSSISEAVASSWVVGTVSTTDTDQPAGVAFKYAVAEVTGTDHASFAIDATTGVLSLKAQPDYETKSSYKVVITTTDGTNGDGKTYSEELNVSVTNVNEAPTVANAIADQIIAENGSLSFKISDNTFADVDVGDTLTYTATQSDGSSLPSWLGFNASTGTFSGTPTDNSFGTIDIKVTATDSGSLSVNDTFNLSFGKQPAFFVTNAVTNDTTKVSVYVNQNAPGANDGVGALSFDLDYEVDLASFSGSNLDFATGFTGLLGVHDTSTGDATIGGYARPNYTAFTTPVLEFDLVPVSALSDLTLRISDILVDDVTFDTQTIVMDIV